MYKAFTSSLFPLWCLVQSGMDSDKDLSGRSYSGVSFLRRCSEDVAFEVMDPPPLS